VDLGPIMAGEIGRETKVKACTVTCHDSTWRLRHDDTRKVDVQITKRILLDGDGLDRAVDLTRLGKFVDGGADPQPVATEQLPTRLFQGKGLGFA